MKMIAALLAVGFLAASVPATAELSVREKNEQFVLSHWVNYDPSAIGTLGTGAGSVDLTSAEALNLVLDRMGDVDMGAFAASAANGEFPAIGDVWLFEIGFDSSCPVPQVIAPRALPTTLIVAGDQFWAYGGPGYVLGTATSDVSLSGFGIAVEWLTKTEWEYSDSVTYGVNSDFFCFDLGFLQLNFPFLNGIANTA